MQFRTFFAQDETGLVVAAASASIYEQGTSNLIPIFDSVGTSIDNPITSGSTGKIAFAAEDGIYDMFIVAGERQYSAVIEFLDVKDTIQELEALTLQSSESADSARTSELNAFGYRESIESIYNDFDTKYLGTNSVDPTTDNNGEPLIGGSLYFNTNTQSLKCYRNSNWVGIDVGSFSEFLASDQSDKGASLVSMEGGPTVEDAINSKANKSESFTRTQIESFFDQISNEVGEVIMFAGNSASLNRKYGQGWRIADGTDGTPNLFDSFPKFGTFAQKGGAGGAKIITPSGSVSVANHTLSKSQMPIHAHSLRVGYSPGGENGPEEGGRDWSGVTSTESEGGSDPHAHGASFSGTNHTNEPQFTYLVPLYFTGIVGTYP